MNPSRFLISTIILFVLCILPWTPANAGTALHDEVQAKYQLYMDAVDAGLDRGIIQARLAEYREVHQRYRSELTGEGIPVGNGERQAVRGNSASAPTARPGAAKVSTTIQKVQTTGKSKLRRILDRLEAQVIKVKDVAQEAQIRLELAYLYQEFKQDLKKAQENIDRVLELAAQNQLGDDVLVQAEELNQRLTARTQVCGMMDGVLSKKQQVYQAREAYHSATWWNPFNKVSKFFSYAKRRVSYHFDIARYRETKEEYELNGKLVLRPTGANYLFDFSRWDFDCRDVFEAMDVSRDYLPADIHLLRNNNDAWYARWYLFEQARQTIDITYFIFDKDAFGMGLFGQLLAKADEGVKVRLMVDAHGTKDFSGFFGKDYLQELAAHPNISVRIFNPVLDAIPRVWKDVRTLVGSNHDKILLVDGEWVITGGRNITKYYFSMHEDIPEALVDSDVIFRSPQLGEKMQTAFSDEFNDLYCTVVNKDSFGNWVKREDEIRWAGKTMDRWIRGQGLYPTSEHKSLEELNGEYRQYSSMVRFLDYTPFPDNLCVPVRILDKHSFNAERNDITENILRLIDAATHEIIFQNPYIEITPVTLAAIRRADARGVKIIIHTTSPASTDSLMSQVFFSEDWKNYLATMPNMRIYAFSGKKVLHSKIFIFDRQISVVGTYNLDYMSEQINSEVVAVVESPVFSEQLRSSVMDDINESMEYKVEVNGGEIKVISGPWDVTPKGTKMKLDLLRKIKFLRPLI